MPRSFASTYWGLGVPGNPEGRRSWAAPCSAMMCVPSRRNWKPSHQSDPTSDAHISIFHFQHTPMIGPSATLKQSKWPKTGLGPRMFQRGA